MTEEREINNTETIKNKEDKANPLTKIITKIVSSIVAGIVTLITVLLSILFTLLILTSPITIPYLINKNKEWKLEEYRCWSYVNNGVPERAIEYVDSIKDSYKLPSMYLCIGTAYYNLNNFQLAFQNFKKVEEMENGMIRSMIYGNKELEDAYVYIAKTLCKMEKYNEADEYYKKVINMAMNTDSEDRYEYGNIIKGIAEVCEEKGSIDNAIKYYQDALIFYCDRCYKEKIDIYKKLAELYEKKGDKVESERYLNMASKLEQEMNQNDQ
jgi:tetratricopeptide (TPR) repeat protein